MNERVSSTSAISPGRAWSSDERERVPRSVRPHHCWGQWDTFEEVFDLEQEDKDGSGDTIDPGDLQEYVRDELEVLATCMDNRPPAWTMARTMPRFQVSELPGGLAIVQAAPRLKQTFPRRAKLDKRQDVNVCA